MLNKKQSDCKNYASLIFHCELLEFPTSPKCNVIQDGIIWPHPETENPKMVSFDLRK